MSCANCFVKGERMPLCSKCKRVGYCSQACQKAHWGCHRAVCNDPSLVEWSPDFLNEFMELLIEHIDVHKVIYLIDREAAQKFKEKTHGGGCSHKHNTIELNEHTTHLEKLVSEVTSRSSLYSILPSYLDQVSQIFENIKLKGKKDHLEMDSETEKKVLGQVLEEGLTRRLVQEVNKLNRKEEETCSKQPLLLAYPSGYKEETNAELDYLTINTVQSLMESDWAIQDEFLDYDSAHGMYAEAESLDFDGRFEELMQQKIKNIRNDGILWVYKHVIDAAIEGKHESPIHLTLSYCKYLKKLSDIYFSLPFELNKKTKLGLQITDCLCLDCFSVGNFHVPHFDSGFGKEDTGRKVTCIYVISNGDGDYVEINGEKVQLRNNRMIILKARKVKIAVPEVSQKLFLAYFYILGPCDPYQ